MFTIEVSDSALKASLSALAARVSNAQPILQAIGDDIMERADRRFSTSTGPDGKRWKANSPATIARKGAGRPPLVGMSGSLRQQFHVNATNSRVTIGNSMIYAAIQQFGGTISIAARSQQAFFKQAKDGSVGNRFVSRQSSNFAQWHTRSAHTITIPARPFLPVRENGVLYPAEQAKILATLNAYLAGK